MTAGKKEIESIFNSKGKRRWIGSSGVFLFSIGFHALVLLVAAGITFCLAVKKKDITFSIKRETKVQEYDPELVRDIFKRPRVLADRIVERPIIMLEDEIEITKDIPLGTSFDSLSNKHLESDSIIDAYGSIGGASGAYGEKAPGGSSYCMCWGACGSCSAESAKTPEEKGPHAIFYLDNGENPFIDASWDRLSTFAIDVDTASYTIARDYIKKGELPPKKTVRIEEFINYMNYEYTSPWNNNFAIHLEAAPSKFGREDAHKLLRVAIKGMDLTSSERKPAVLTFVIDVSQSMSEENRLVLVKKSLKLLLDQLMDGDKVGIVIYSTEATLITEPLPISEREKLVSAIESLQIDYWTNLDAGLMLGYEIAERHFQRHATNRIILCSDGVPTRGETSAEKILEKAKKYIEKGINISTIGIGTGHDDEFMEKLADKGNGNYVYLDTCKEAERLFADCAVGLLEVLGSDMKVQVDFNPDVVDSYRLLGYENRKIADKDFRNDKVDAGEIGPGHSVTALYELKLHDDVAEGIVATVFVRYKDPEYQDEVKEIKQSFPLASIRETFEDASADFRLAAATAELAEVLKDSFFARESDLEPVVELTEYLAHEMYDREDVQDLAKLVKKAREVRTDKVQKRVALERSEDNVSRIPRDKSAIIVGIPR